MPAQDETDEPHGDEANSDIVVDITSSELSVQPPASPTKPASGVCIVCLEHVVTNHTQPTSPPLAAPLLPHPRDVSSCTCQYDAHAACLREWFAYKRECPMCRQPVPQTTPNETQHVEAQHVLPHWAYNDNDAWYTRCRTRAQRVFNSGTCNCACVVVFGVLFFGWIIVGQVVNVMQEEQEQYGNSTNNPWSPDMGFL